MNLPTKNGEFAAGFFPRAAAYLLDYILLTILLLGLRIPLACIELVNQDLFLFTPILFQFDVFDLIFYLLSVAYFVVFTTLTGTTPGKRAFCLAVVDEEGEKIGFWKAVYRETIGRYLSSFLFFGYIMILIDKRKRSFHDYLCDTSVIYTRTIRVVEKVKRVPELLPYQPIPQQPGMLPPYGQSQPLGGMQYAKPQPFMSEIQPQMQQSSEQFNKEEPIISSEKQDVIAYTENKEENSI